VGLKDERWQQRTTEFSRVISPQAKGERIVASLLAKQPLPLIFWIAFFRE